MKKTQTKKVLYEYSVTIDVLDKYDKEKEDKRAILTNRRKQDRDLKEVGDIMFKRIFKDKKLIVKANPNFESKYNHSSVNIDTLEQYLKLIAI